MRRQRTTVLLIHVHETSYPDGRRESSDEAVGYVHKRHVISSCYRYWYKLINY